MNGLPQHPGSPVGLVLRDPDGSLFKALKNACDQGHRVIVCASNAPTVEPDSSPATAAPNATSAPSNFRSLKPKQP